MEFWDLGPVFVPSLLALLQVHRLKSERVKHPCSIPAPLCSQQWCQDSSSSDARNKSSSALPLAALGVPGSPVPPTPETEGAQWIQTHLRRVHSQEAQAKRPQAPSGHSVLLPWGEARGAWYFTGLSISSSPRFMMLLRGSLCCNVTSLYREIFLSNGFCRFFKGIFILSFIGIELKQN